MNQKTALHDFLNIGISLSSEKDIEKLLNDILHPAMHFTNADEGCIYLAQEESTLKYETLHTKSRETHWGGTKASEHPINTSPIALFRVDGEPDVYNATGFNFSGTHHLGKINN